MSRSKAIFVNLEDTEFDFDAKNIADQMPDLVGILAIHSAGIQKAMMILVFEARSNVTSQQFKTCCQQATVTSCGDVQPRLEEFAELVIKHCYKPYAAGCLVVPWREALGQSVDGKTTLFIVTIPHYDPDLPEVVTAIEELVRADAFTLSGAILSKEHHFSGDKHLHALLKINAPYKFKLPELWSKLGAQGDIQKVIDEDRVREYILKKYQEGSPDFYAMGCYELPQYQNVKLGGNEVLDSLVQEIITKKTNPWKFLNDKSKLIRLTAFRNRKALETLWYDSQRIPLQVLVPLVMPKKPKNGPFLRIWQWLEMLRTHEIRSPSIPNRHLFLSGATGTRKSNFASLLCKSFKCFHFDVHDTYFDGYNDGFDLGICDEFNVMKPSNGKDLVNLNRFLEGAAGQLLNVKYQKAVKTDTTLPCLFISNLSEKAIAERALVDFDVEIVRAFFRRFVFVDIGSSPFPDDFTVIGPIVKSKNVETQTDEMYYPPFQFTTVCNFSSIPSTVYLAVPISSIDPEKFTTAVKLSKEFKDPQNWADTDYMIVSKNKGSKFTNPGFFNVATEFLDCGIIQTTRDGFTFRTTSSVYSDRKGNAVEVNTTIFPPIETLKIAVVEICKDNKNATWLDYYRFYLKIDKFGVATITPSTEFIVHDLWYTTMVSGLSSVSSIAAAEVGLACILKLVGFGLRFVAQIKENCSICLESTQTYGIILACSHVFHIDCLLKVMCADEFRCPNCRATAENLSQINELYVGCRTQCCESTCEECSNPLYQEQGVIGCSCTHCVSERLKIKQLVIA